MTAPSGREPARSQPGTDGTAASTSSAGAQPRLSREAVVAFALLPVLLVAGFFLGSRLLGDTTDPGTTTAVGATSGPAADAEETVVGPPAAGPEDPAVQGPAVQGPGVEGPAEEPAVQGPAAPEQPAQPAEPAQPAAPEQPAQPAAPEQPAQPAEPAQPAAPAPAPAPQAAVAGSAPVPQAGENVLLFKGFAGEDVRTWQQRMVERGWSLRVDGIYGPESASVAQKFQAQKGLRVDGLVGINTWNAAWQAPIT